MHLTPAGEGLNRGVARHSRAFGIRKPPKMNLIRNLSSAPLRFGRASKSAMLAAGAGAGLLLASPAWAAGGAAAVPWEGPLTTVMEGRATLALLN